MPRKMRCRRICFEPDNRVFAPGCDYTETVTLALEEFEALRLADREALEQDEAALKMDVSRGTFQRILYAARYKVADALANGKRIVIEGGNYAITGRKHNCNQCCRMCETDGENKEIESNE